VTRPARSPSSISLSRASLANLARQRLFPVLAALWFAALFGLGGVAASGDALAGIVLRLHLPAVLPAAAPPLGTTAHGLIAVGLAGLGAIAGLMLGLIAHRRAGGPMSDIIRTRPIKAAAVPREPVRAEPPVAAASTPRVRNRDAHPDAPPRRPLVVTEDVIPYHAPVGAAVVETPAEPADEAARPVVMAPTWVAAELAADNDSVGDFHDRPETPFGSFFTGQSPAAPETLPPFFAGAFAAQADASPDLAPEGPGLPDAPIEGPVAPDQETTPAAPLSLACQASAAPQAPIAQVPVASLGLVQLIERLALAIADRQAHRAERAPVGWAVAPGAGSHADVPATDLADQRMPLHRFDPLTMDPGGPLLRAKPARLGRIGDAAGSADENRALDEELAPVAASLHDPLGDADSGHADWALSEIDLPPRFLGGSAAQQDQSVDGSAQDDVRGEAAPVESRYSSLINMAMPRPELVAPHIGPNAGDRDAPGAHGLPPADDPVVRFPFASTRPTLADGATDEHPAATEPRARIDDADRALRDALATLRRMSVKR
jgi:hypothetical protein